MTNDFSPSDLKAIFARFKAVYGHFGAMGLKDDPQTFTQEWYSQLKHYSVSEVTKAVETWLESSRDQWPKPGQLRGLIYEGRQQPKRHTYTDREPEERCLCGDPTCKLSYYRMPSGCIRLAMDCLARQYHYPREGA